MEIKTISVIIPAKDAAATIEACLRGVMSQRDIKGNLEVILVDDGSTDRTADLAEDLGAKVIRQKNAGPAAARNTGARSATGEILAFTDSDCVPSDQWLHFLTKPFRDSVVIGTKGIYQTDQNGLIPRFVQQEYQFKYLRLADQESIDFIDTYSAAYRRDIFLENGGFDSAFAVPSVEDQELSFRLARKGYRMVFAPDAAVYHRHDRDIWEYGKRKFGIGYWKAFMLRWLPEKTFQDSHTPGTLRWQILFLASLLSSLILAGLFWEMGWWLALGSIILFYIASLPFLLHIRREDHKLLLVAPLLLVLRAGALGVGLVSGFIFPPREQPRAYTGLGPVERFLKRFVDIIGSLVGLLVFFPILIIASLVIKLDSSGPVIFAQDRAGENGKPFRVYKLRTMRAGAEHQVADVLADNLLDGPVFKIPNDPRVTRVGRTLRRWSFDEIPQFWNVLKGDMSLVGPRPEEIWVVEQYNDQQRQRLAVKPGLTGPMQVSGRGELDMDARLTEEVSYINNYSIWRDILILLRTIPAVISGKGAF